MTFSARRYAVVFALAIPFALAACAGDVAKPDAIIQALPADRLASPHVTQVTATAGPGVTMAPADLDRISAVVKAQMASAVVDPTAQTTPPSMSVRMVFTHYDGDSAFERFMQMGLGPIHVDAYVLFVENASGQVIGQYKVSKNFTLGGWGGATTLSDVEAGFAKSVAALIVKRP